MTDWQYRICKCTTCTPMAFDTSLKLMPCPSLPGNTFLTLIDIISRTAHDRWNTLNLKVSKNRSHRFFSFRVGLIWTVNKCSRQGARLHDTFEFQLLQAQEMHDCSKDD